MKKLMFVLALTMLPGCGMSQSQLKDINGILQQAQDAECDRVKAYLAVVQAEIQKKISK